MGADDLMDDDGVGDAPRAPRVAANAAALEAWVGDELGVSGWFVVTSARIAAYRAATGDPEADGERPAPSLYLLGLSTTLADQVMRVESVRMATYNSVENLEVFAPVAVGARVRLRCFVDKVNRLEGLARLVLRGVIEVERRGDAPATAMSWRNTMLIWE